MSERIARLVTNVSKRTIAVTTTFTLGLPMDKMFVRHDLIMASDDLTGQGKRFVVRLLGNDAPDGWTHLYAHNAYKFEIAWGEMFSQTDMAAMLTDALRSAYTPEFRLDTEVAGVNNNPAASPHLRLTAPPAGSLHSGPCHMAGPLLWERVSTGG